MPDGAPTTYTELADVLDALPLLCREKRRRCGLSIREAARQIGVSFSTVHRIEDGKGAHLDNATAILRWLDDRTHVNQCEHEWSERGSGDLAWRECRLCGEQTPYETRPIPPGQQHDGSEEAR